MKVPNWAKRSARAGKPEVREVGLKAAPVEGLFLEFGCYQGRSTLFFRRLMDAHEIYGWPDETFYAFDSFEGIEEDWREDKAGLFNLGGKCPFDYPGVEVIVGKVQKTLPGFLRKHPEPIAFIHLDTDTYKPAKFILEAVKPRLQEGTVIVFDELWGYPGFHEHEWKALGESEIQFEIIASEKEAVAIRVVQNYRYAK